MIDLGHALVKDRGDTNFCRYGSNRKIARSSLLERLEEGSQVVLRLRLAPEFSSVAIDLVQPCRSTFLEANRGHPGSSFRWMMSFALSGW